jgi:hypothetical protein
MSPIWLDCGSVAVDLPGVASGRGSQGKEIASLRTDPYAPPEAAGTERTACEIKTSVRR